MKESRQALLGVAAALISSAIILGGLSLSILEGGFKISLAPTATSTALITLVIHTALPGAPTFTPTPLRLPTLTATFVPTPKCQPPPGWTTILLPADTTMAGLAQSYNVTVQALADANCMVPITSGLPQDTTFNVPQVPPPATPPLTPTEMPTPAAPQCGPPPGWFRYNVRYGDTIYSLSLALGINPNKLITANCLGTNAYLVPGRSIWVPFYPVILPPPTLPYIPMPARPTPRPFFPTARPTKIPTARPTPAFPPTILPLPTRVPPTQPPPPTKAPPTQAPPTQPPPPTQVPPTQPLPPTPVPPTQPPPPTRVPPTVAPPPTQPPPPPTQGPIPSGAPPTRPVHLGPPQPPTQAAPIQLTPASSQKSSP